MNKKTDSNAIAAAFDSVYEFNDISKQFEGDPREGPNKEVLPDIIQAAANRLRK